MIEKKKRKKNSGDDENDNDATSVLDRNKALVLVSKFSEAVVEGLPQLVIQLIVAITTDTYNTNGKITILIISVIASVVAMLKACWEGVPGCRIVAAQSLNYR